MNLAATKKRIQTHFNRASSTYESVAYVQKECAQHLVALLERYHPSFYPTSILDIGTGTGYIPEALLPLFPQSQYYLNDLSSEMLAYAQEKLGQYTNFSFITADMDTLPLTHHQLIISNFALQWSTKLTYLLQRLYQHTDVLAFTCLLKDTFHEWSALFTQHTLPSPTYSYPTKMALNSYLKKLGPKHFYSGTQTFHVRFNSIYDFVKYLQKLGANTSSCTFSSSAFKMLRKQYHESFYTSYQVYFAILKGI